MAPNIERARHRERKGDVMTLNRPDGAPGMDRRHGPYARRGRQLRSSTSASVASPLKR